MAAITQLTPFAMPGQRYGSFAGRSAAVTHKADLVVGDRAATRLLMGDAALTTLSIADAAATRLTVRDHTRNE